MTTFQEFQSFSKPLQVSWKRYEKSYRKIQKDPNRKNVHSFRDSIQKLNAILEMIQLLHPSKSTLDLVEELKNERKILGKLRDSQVELRLLKDFRKQPFFLFLKKRKNKAQKRVLKNLEKFSLKSQQLCVDHLQKTLKTRRLVDDDWQVFQKTMSAQQLELYKDLPKISEVPDRRMHELRVLSKKLLFQGEVLQDLNHKEPDTLNIYREIHDTLGEVQNEVVLLKVLDKYLNRKKNSKDRVAVDLTIDITEDRNRKLEEARQHWSVTSWQH